jgi:2-(3-amino-3-carboxypropyl)histidine synthase
MEIDLQLDRVLDEIRRTKAKTVLIQLPDGLKPKAGEIADALQGFGAEILIWQGSCFGACDAPEVKGVDMLVQFGHSEWL